MAAADNRSAGPVCRNLNRQNREAKSQPRQVRRPRRPRSDSQLLLTKASNFRDRFDLGKERVELRFAIDCYDEIERRDSTSAGAMCGWRSGTYLQGYLHTSDPRFLARAITERTRQLSLVKLDFEQLSAHESRAELYCKAGQFGKAVDDYDAMLPLASNATQRAIAHFKVASVLSVPDKRDDAVARVRKAAAELALPKLGTIRELADLIERRAKSDEISPSRAEQLQEICKAAESNPALTSIMLEGIARTAGSR